jgi:hypothetical protein
LEDTAEDMLPLAERLGGCVEMMHSEWREALERAATSWAAARHAADQERAERAVGPGRCALRGGAAVGGRARCKASADGAKGEGRLACSWGWSLRVGADPALACRLR